MQPDASTSRGLSSFALKVVAIVAMTCNHAGYVFEAHLSLAARCALVGVGGMTFPIMAFLLVEGFVHTSNVRHYALRLGAFALVSQVPYYLVLAHQANVIFTLFVCLVMLVVCSKVEEEALHPLIAIACAALTIRCDWGVLGPLMAYFLYAARGQIKGVLFATALPAFTSIVAYARSVVGGSLANLPHLLYGVGNLAAIPLLAAYNGQRGAYPLKWFFYVYYPAHIAALGLLHFALFGTMPAVT